MRTGSRFSRPAVASSSGAHDGARPVTCACRSSSVTASVGSVGWLVVSADELALGLGVRLTVIPIALGERLLQRHVLARETRVRAQKVTEAQARLELLEPVHKPAGSVTGGRVPPGRELRKVDRTRRCLVSE